MDLLSFRMFSCLACVILCSFAAFAKQGYYFQSNFFLVIVEIFKRFVSSRGAAADCRSQT